MLQSLFAISIILLILALFKIKSLKQEITALTAEASSEHKELSYLSEYNNKVQEIKTQKENQILELFTKEAKVSNRDVVKLLQISSATAFRYLDDLEKAGKIAQNGKFGKTVFYSKIK
ncbi:winged helix-turn-helix transcriptional regulator [Candidatus Falkowbacteria bacterium]|uniref:HTH deoR-type domain-containing protein n=1 Tax=Candidatus Buchananbacteria bacterium CG10_big_fil_rev_8_21_14_0_10_33_19 TaxID=1974525 RepID=A0A2H0W2T1_9BACT|nr:winged helix-turn-helix transcriptional regulator [Candidatus Falkowbacteria bacterium]PIS05685.1 MAG: hypothetical protein COT80_02855 [Candidatus Buchananbacteria bacterium CG10_big_fil_rev_8_21_14_0_10_33_19]